MPPQLSILMPLYNEEALLSLVVAELLETLPSLGISFELLLLENGSTDRTLEIARQLEATNSTTVRAFHIETPDYGAALTEGLKVARGEFGAVFEIDFINVEFVRDRLVELRSGIDMVIGSKMHPGSQDERPFTRKVYTVVYNFLLYLFFGFRGHETHGLKLFRIAPLLQPACSCVTRGDTFTTEWVIRCQWAGARIVEVPISIREVREARIPPIKRIPRAARNLLMMINAMQLRGPLMRISVSLVCLILALFGLWGYWQAQGQRNFGPDEGIYTYVGWSWGAGHWPYLNSWDHKGPVVYATTMLRTALAGTEPETLGGQEIMLGTATAILLAGIGFYLWGAFGSSVALALGILIWAQWPPEYGHMSTPGSLIALFTTGAIFTAFATNRRVRFGASAVLAVVMGLCSGLAICTKPNAIAGPVIGLAIIWWAGRQTRVTERLLLMLLSVLGVAIVITAFAVLFYNAGALGALIDTYFVFNSLRGRLMLEESSIFNLVFRFLRTLHRVGLVPLTVAVLAATTIAAIRGRLFKASSGLIGCGGEFIVPAWLLIELALLMLNGSYGHHVYPVLPAVALGGTWLVMAPLRAAFLPGRGWALVVFLLLFTPPMLGVTTIDPPRSEVERRSSDWNSVVDILADTTDPDDTVFTLNNWSGPGIMSLIHRRSASRYMYPIPMYARGYVSDERWAEVLAEIQGRKPPKIILLNTRALKAAAVEGMTLELALNSFDRPAVPPELADKTVFPHRERLKAFIANNYSLECCRANLCLLRRLN